MRGETATLKSQSKDKWAFKTARFEFSEEGMAPQDFLGQFKDLITNTTNMQFVMQLGFNGIGLPQSMFDGFR